MEECPGIFERTLFGKIPPDWPPAARFNLPGRLIKPLIGNVHQVWLGVELADVARRLKFNHRSAFLLAVVVLDDLAIVPRIRQPITQLGRSRWLIHERFHKIRIRLCSPGSLWVWQGWFRAHVRLVAALTRSWIFGRKSCRINSGVFVQQSSYCARLLYAEIAVCVARRL